MWKTTSEIRIVRINLTRGQFQDLCADVGKEQIGKLQILKSHCTVSLLVNVVSLFQHRITKLAPREQTEEDLSNLFEKSLTVF
jgi:hypothetical protein